VLIAALSWSGGRAWPGARREHERGARHEHEERETIRRPRGKGKSAYLQRAHPGPLARSERRRILGEPDGREQISGVVAHRAGALKGRLEEDTEKTAAMVDSEKDFPAVAPAPDPHCVHLASLYNAKCDDFSGQLR